MAGGIVDRLYGPSGVVSLPGRVAIDPAAGQVYWANEVDNTIRGASLAGGGIANALYDAANEVKGPGAVAIDPAGGASTGPTGATTRSAEAGSPAAATATSSTALRTE